MQFKPDEEAKADRTPCRCPHCEWDGAFDAHGQKTEERIVQSLMDGDGTADSYTVRWQEIHCPQCGGLFQIPWKVTENHNQ